ncbi:hypothetical protein GIB67_009702, partial [Kingdonia uniflora]
PRLSHIFIPLDDNSLKSLSHHVSFSHHSQRLAHLSATNPNVSNVVPQVKEYTRERLQELSSRTLANSRFTATPQQPIIVLKGFVKPLLENLGDGDELEIRGKNPNVGDSEINKDWRNWGLG